MSETQEVAQAAEAQEIANQEVETTESAQSQAEAPETVTEADQEVSTQTAKTFTQEQVDAIAAKEHARALRQAERKAAKAYEAKLEELTRQSQQSQAQRQEVKVEGKPQLSQFEKVEDYVEAVADWKLQAHQQAQAQQSEEQRARQFHEEVQTKAKTAFELAEQDPEFDIAEFEELPISEPMAYAIMDSEIAPKVMLHLQKNPDEVDRIAKLSPARQAAEIGKLEVKLSAPKEVKVSKAPAPVKPVGSRGATSVGTPEQMSQRDFEAWLYKNTTKR